MEEAGHKKIPSLPLTFEEGTRVIALLRLRYARGATLIVFRSQERCPTIGNPVYRFVAGEKDHFSRLSAAWEPPT